MLKRLGILAVFSLFAVFSTVVVLDCTSVACAGEVPEIRVQLQANTNVAQVEVVQGKYQVLDGATGLPLGTAGAGEVCTITKEGPSLTVSGTFREKRDCSQTGAVCLKPSDEASILSFRNIKYRGAITVHNTATGLLVVNSLPVEQYLYGVVGQEMGYGAPLEALKSQAVVSRSYALKKKGSGLYADLSSTSQAYRGYNGELVSGFDRVKKAVDATAGEVVCYQDSIIDAVFHSNSGGCTEASENVWNAPVPYLRPAASPEDAYAVRYSYQDANGYPGNCYQWSITITREQLEQCIANWNAAHPKDVINIGELKNIKLSRVDSTTGEETASGRVTALTLVGSSGKKVITKDNIRSFFKVDGKILKSTLFDLEFDSDPTDAAASHETYVAGVRVTSPLFSRITINGKGNGHGLGLSQWGARGMAAEQDADYIDIIKHYYSGVEIKELY